MSMANETTSGIWRRLPRRLSWGAFIAVLTLLAQTAGAWPIADIRLQGLQRVSAGTVFNMLPVNVGDEVDDITIRQLVRLLFRSGYFNDIRMAEDEGVLIISFVERPAIESIELDGNKAIETDALLSGLGQQGLKEGEIFKQSTLDRVGLELKRQYVAQGRYSATIDTEVEKLPRNRVAIKIEIEEGKNSGIRHINFVGNTVFNEEKLLDNMELKHPSLLSFYKNDDKYAREKLSGDLEKIESYYRDRGYVEFELDSTQVSITPDRRQVYITLHMNEGDKYEVDEVKILGELNEIAPEALEAFLVVQPGQTFSQARVTASEERITQALGNSGYTFATATGVPRVSDDGTVDVEFFIDAQKRAYVRRVSFSGNALTQDEVMRREMRQMEGGWASTAQIDLSKVRLERLGYFKGVDVETPEVPGTDDQIDVNFSLEEQPSGSISATVGYAQSFGLLLGASYQQSNVMGTGNSLGVSINYSDFQKALSYSYFNPYYTLDGISRGYNVFVRQLDFDERNIARFTTDSVGAGLTFGFPIGETQRISFGGLVEFTDLTAGRFPAQEIREFLALNGNEHLNFKLNAGWTSSVLNRGLFPTRGHSQALNLELAVPGSDLEFFKVTYNGQIYFPITDNWTLRLRTELGYGDGYGDTETLPFFEHFYGGGFGSVRGFESSSLGPRSTPAIQEGPDGTVQVIDFGERQGDPFGGNLQFEASAEIIFPLPFVDDQRQFRPVLFVDAGNVFNTDCPEVSINCFEASLDEMRYSVGVSVTWLTGLGPMTFSFAKPFNTSDLDEREAFQFELGKTF